MTDAASLPPRRGARALALLAVAGLAVSGWLTFLHVRVHNDPAYLPVCAVNETVNCATVAASPRAVFLGLPVAIWGLAGYLLLLALALRGLGRRRGPGDGAGFLALLGIAFVGVSAALALVAVFSLGAVCPDCLATYAVNLAVAVVAVVRVRRRGGLLANLNDDLAALRREPAAGLGPWLAALLAVALPRALVPPYWELPGRDAPGLASGVDEEGHPWLGGADPKVVVHEFIDYECPHCQVAHRRLRRALAEDPASLRIVRHDYARMPCAPNDAVRRMSRCELARAGVCAADQGRFWDWNDRVFTRPRPLRGEGRKTFVPDTARALGLDPARFEACLFAPETVERAQRFYKEARKARIADTPSYVIDGKRLTLAEALRGIESSR
jgi:uncharacterized membrane protein/protein-disulfide isomerase